MTHSLHSDQAQQLILEKMLLHVPQEGWTFEALRKGVVDAGFAEGDAYRVFGGDLDQALEYHLGCIDRLMEQKLATLDLAQMRVKDKIATAIMLRLRLVEPHKQAVGKCLAYLANPLRTSVALKSLYNTVNTIWYAVGDQSTDFNFYTKRALLAGVYGATLRYWVTDSSEESMATRAYLNRRLDQVMQIPSLKKKVTAGVTTLFNTVCGFAKRP